MSEGRNRVLVPLMIRSAVVLLLLLPVTAAGGCATLFGGDGGPVPLTPVSAVQIRSGRATGTGCLLYSEYEAGAYVLTAAHLLHAPDHVLCRFHARADGPTWRSARVLRMAPRRDLALLWIPRAIPGGTFRAAWAGDDPGAEAPVVLFPAAEVGAPRRIVARVKAPGRLVADAELAPGMSGAGVFRQGRLAGLLFGQPRRADANAAREGRFIGVEGIRAFLETGFGFVVEGTLPAEPR